MSRNRLSGSAPPRLPPPFTAGGRRALADSQALLRRFIMTEVLAPPLALRPRPRRPLPPPGEPESPQE
ncbi:MAG: hypothetical protein QGH45_15850 [Myxococcota bacterium]|nr:hypothetical protein [Myxococcota bacterium]